MRNSSSLDWLRFMHTPNDYRVSRFVSAKKGGINTKVPLINQKTEILQSTQNRKPLDSLLNQGASLKTAATYSPTVTQYHRRDEA